MSKREKVLMCISAVTLIVLTVTSVSLYNLKNNSQFLQNQIDNKFIYSLNIAVSTYRGVDEAGFANEYTEETFYKNAYICTDLYSLTSYSDNETFAEINILLSETLRLHKIPKLSDELITCILKYVPHPNEYAELEPEITEEIQKILDDQF